MIRPYTQEDTDELVETWHQASLIAHSFLDEEFFSRERIEIPERWLPIAETWVHEENGQVVGFISLVENEVGAIFVHPSFQNRGIGRGLMDHARSARGFLELEVFDKNEIGRRFYDKYGFEVVDRRLDDETGQIVLLLRLH